MAAVHYETHSYGCNVLCDTLIWLHNVKYWYDCNTSCDTGVAAVHYLTHRYDSSASYEKLV